MSPSAVMANNSTPPASRAALMLGSLVWNIPKTTCNSIFTTLKDGVLLETSYPALLQQHPSFRRTAEKTVANQHHAFSVWRDGWTIIFFVQKSLGCNKIIPVVRCKDFIWMLVFVGRCGCVGML